MRAQTKNKSGGVASALRENSKVSQPHFGSTENESGDNVLPSEFFGLRPKVAAATDQGVRKRQAALTTSHGILAT
jgi:hypothetical protein